MTLKVKERRVGGIPRVYETFLDGKMVMGTSFEFAPRGNHWKLVSGCKI